MSKKKSKSKSSRLQKYKDLLSNLQKRFPKWKLLALGIVAIIALVVVLAVVLWPSNEATTARDGDTVRVDYTGTLDDGTIFDSTTNESFNHTEPLEFTIGDGQMIPGFDRGVIGMSVNQKKTIHVAPEFGYGPKYFEVDLDDLPEDPQIGETVFKTDAYGKTVKATVINISESSATLENQAELAGETLNFEITLVELIKAGQAATNTSG